MPVGVGVAAAMQDGVESANNTTTTTVEDSSQSGNWTPPGPYTRELLRKPGAHDPDAEDSIRLIGDPVRGGLGIRYQPAKPTDNDWTWLEPGTTIRSNQLQVKATAFGDATGEYTLVVVYWEQASTRVQTTDGIVTRQYAANQTVQRVTIDLENGYTTQEIELQSVYDGSKKMSMWLERDGEVVDGARWTKLSHETNPLSKAPASPVSSKYDLWQWAALTILAPAIPGILLGRRTAQHVLDRTIVSTQRGLGFWFGVLLVTVITALTAAWWQFSVIASALPFVAGLLLAAIAFVGYMGMYDNQVERAEFNQKNIEDTTSVTGDESKTARYEDIKLRNIIRRDGNIYMPSSGIRPLLARYWASPAQVDESDLTTVTDVNGDVSKKYEVDPDADETLVHTPAHLSFEPEWTEPLADRTRAEIDREVAKYSDMDSFGASLMTVPLAAKKVLAQVNWQFVAVSVGGFAIIYSAVNASLGLQTVASALGLLPLAIAGTKAKDGSLQFDPAPYHFSEARAILAKERETYAEAKTFEDLEEQLADQEFDHLERALSLADTVRDETQTKIDDLFGTNTTSNASTDRAADAAGHDTGREAATDD